MLVGYEKWKHRIKIKELNGRQKRSAFNFWASISVIAHIKRIVLAVVGYLH